MADCSTSSVLGIGISIMFGIFYALTLIGVSLYSWHFLMKYDIKFAFSWCGHKFKRWAMDVYKRRRCYVPIITHLTDKITDIAVVIEFAQLAEHTEKNDCGIDMSYLLYLSIFVLLLYSTISSFLIYQTTKSIRRLIMQFLDFELFRTLYINYLCDKDEPCSPQRWITSLEAAFESTPQALLQTIFLVKTQTFSSSPVVVASLMFSLWSIISKITSDDKVIAIQHAKHLSIHLKSCKSCSPSCVSWTFILRYLWRIGDVSSRILIVTLLWLVLGGAALSIILATESIIILTISAKTKRTEFLFGMVATVVSKSSAAAKRISAGLMLYRCVTNLIFMSIITSILYSSNKCWKCSTYEERQKYLSSDSVVVPILIYTWITIALTPCLSIYLTKQIFIGEKSTARRMKDMIRSQDWDGIVEMQAYKGAYGVYDEETKENLLMLAVKCHYGKLVSHIISGYRVDVTQTSASGATILDYIMSTIENRDAKKSEQNKKYINELLMHIANNCPNILTADGNGNVLYVSCYIGDTTAYQDLINMNKFDASNAWQFAVSGDQPDMIQYLLNQQQSHHNSVFDDATAFIPRYADLNDPNEFAIQMIGKKRIKILNFILNRNTNVDQYRVWLYAVNHGDLKVIKATKPHINSVNTLATDNKGRTVLHIACQKGDERDMNAISYLRTVVDENLMDDRGKTADYYLTSLAINDGATYKTLLLGSKESGKSALTIRYVSDTSTAEYDPTIEDSYKKQVVIDDHTCLVDILDTAGQEEWAALRHQWIQEASIYILVYSITDRGTFDDVIGQRDRIRKLLDLDEAEYVPIVLVGNNCHLEDKRRVSTEEGQALIEKWGKEQHMFFEASAKQNINVNKVFEEGVRLYWKINGME
eukprot:59810_1